MCFVNLNSSTINVPLSRSHSLQQVPRTYIQTTNNNIKMGWYRDKNSARRVEARTEVAEALSRFQASIVSGTECQVDLKDFTGNVQDNYNFKVIPQILVDPTPQDTLIEKVNETTEDMVAIAIAFSHYLQKFDGVSEQVCHSLQGLFLFGTINVDSEDLIQFIRRCPNLKSLSLVQVDNFDKAFLTNLFDSNLVPKLEFLEVSHANDNGIAAMHTAPKLHQIVFRWPDPSITDDGFKRLVANGGAANLVAIAVRFDQTRATSTIDARARSFLLTLLGNSQPRLQGGTLEDDLSTTLSKSFLKTTLPKFVAGEALDHDLKHISVGKRQPSLEMQLKAKYAKQDSLPFAVIPPERMSFDQLRQAFKDRGFSESYIPPSIVKMRAALVKAGFTMEEEGAIQNNKHAEYLSRTRLPPIKAEIKKLEAKIKKIEKHHSTKLYPELLKPDMIFIMKKTYKEAVPYKWTRNDVANALHQRKYQGGGTGTSRITILAHELTRVEQEALDVESKIESLQISANKYFHQKKSAKPAPGAKQRPLAPMN
jgi:hypothetical protein